MAFVWYNPIVACAFFTVSMLSIMPGPSVGLAKPIIMFMAVVLIFQSLFIFIEILDKLLVC
jgi:hypothetical protein